jgi:hypothetical protein
MFGEYEKQLKVMDNISAAVIMKYSISIVRVITNSTNDSIRGSMFAIVFLNVVSLKREEHCHSFSAMLLKMRTKQ